MLLQYPEADGARHKAHTEPHYSCRTYALHVARSSHPCSSDSGPGTEAHGPTLAGKPSFAAPGGSRLRNFCCSASGSQFRRSNLHWPAAEAALDSAALTAGTGAGAGSDGPRPLESVPFLSWPCGTGDHHALIRNRIWPPSGVNSTQLGEGSRLVESSDHAPTPRC